MSSSHPESLPHGEPPLGAQGAPLSPGPMPAAVGQRPPGRPPGQRPPGRPPDDAPRWSAWQALLAFVAAYLGTATLLVIVSVFALPAGVDLEKPPPAFNVVGVLLQDIVFIGAALAFAAITARPRRSHFGVRRTPFWGTLGWAVVGLVAYLTFTLVYQALFDPEGSQSIAEALGVQRGTLMLILGGFVVIVMAPIAEEFFFRAFFYRAVRNSLSRGLGRAAGVLLGAMLTGALFGVMHLEPGRIQETLSLIPLLVVLGVVFCLVYEKTRSLFAVVGLHAVVNMFGYLLVAKYSWIVALGFGTVMVVACIVLPRLLARGPAAQPA
jgi:uncharacterized protein